MTRAFPNYDQRAFPVPGETSRFPSGGNVYTNPQADPLWTSVQALFGFNGANSSAIGDESDVFPALDNQLYFGQARVRTGHFQFGPTALDLDGAGDYIRWDDHAGFSPGSKDFTLEMWIYRNDISNATFASKYSGTVSTAEWFTNITVPNFQFFFYYGTGANSFDFLSQSWEVTAEAWHHIAVDRVKHDFFMYVDGTMMSSANFANRIMKNTTQRPNIGARVSHPSPQYFDGWIDEFRFTLGHARYGGNDFTPVGPFPRF